LPTGPNTVHSLGKTKAGRGNRAAAGLRLSE